MMVMALFDSMVAGTMILVFKRRHNENRKNYNHPRSWGQIVSDIRSLIIR